MKVVELTYGEVEYEDTGGDVPIVVLLHGLAMDAPCGAKWLPVCEVISGASCQPSLSVVIGCL